MAEYRAFSTATDVVDADGASVNLGTEFYVTEADVTLTKVHWYQPAGTGRITDTRIMHLWSVNTDGLAGVLVAGPWNVPPVGTGWQTYTLPTPFALTQNQRYRIVTRHPLGKYPATSGYFLAGDGASGHVNGPLTIPNNAASRGTRQGSYSYSPSNVFPSSSFNGANYWNDITISSNAITTTAPIVSLSLVENRYAWGDNVSITATVVDNDIGAVVTTAWTVPTKPGDSTLTISSTSNSITFAPDRPGTYVVRATATDETGRTGFAETTVNVYAYAYLKVGGVEVPARFSVKSSTGILTPSASLTPSTSLAPQG